MAEIDSLLSGLMGATDVFMITLTIVLILVMVVGVVWFIWYYKKFENKITIRKKTKGKTDNITFDKYRYYKKKGDSETIQLWSTRKFKPCPPDDAKDFTKKGKEYVECYEASTGELKYITVQDKIISVKFEAIDTDDKEFYANAFVQAQKLKRRSFLDIITENIGVIVLVLIFLIALAFWEEITKPMIEVSANNVKISNQNLEILQSMETICRDRQYIPPEVTGEVKPPD